MSWSDSINGWTSGLRFEDGDATWQSTVQKILLCRRKGKKKLFMVKLCFNFENHPNRAFIASHSIYGKSSEEIFNLRMVASLA